MGVNLQHHFDGIRHQNRIVIEIYQQLRVSTLSIVDSVARCC